MQVNLFALWKPDENARRRQVKNADLHSRIFNVSVSLHFILFTAVPDLDVQISRQR